MKNLGKILVSFIVFLLFFISLNINIIDAQDDFEGSEATLPEDVSQASQEQIVNADPSSVTDDQVSQIAERGDYNQIYDQVQDSELKDRLAKARTGADVSNTPSGAVTGTDLDGNEALQTSQHKSLPLKSGTTYSFNDDGSVSFEDTTGLFISNGEGVELTEDLLKVVKADEVKCAGTNSQKVINLDCKISAQVVNVEKASVVLAENGQVVITDIKDSQFTTSNNKLIEAKLVSNKDDNQWNFFSADETIPFINELIIKADKDKKLTIKYRADYNGKPSISIEAEKDVEILFDNFKHLFKQSGFLSIVADNTFIMSNGVLAHESFPKFEHVDSCEQPTIAKINSLTGVESIDMTGKEFNCIPRYTSINKQDSRSSFTIKNTDDKPIPIYFKKGGYEEDNLPPSVIDDNYIFIDNDIIKAKGIFSYERFPSIEDTTFPDDFLKYELALSKLVKDETDFLPVVSSYHKDNLVRIIPQSPEILVNATNDNTWPLFGKEELLEINSGIFQFKEKAVNGEIRTYHYWNNIKYPKYVITYAFNDHPVKNRVDDWFVIDSISESGREKRVILADPENEKTTRMLNIIERIVQDLHLIDFAQKAKQAFSEFKESLYSVDK